MSLCSSLLPFQNSSDGEEGETKGAAAVAFFFFPRKEIMSACEMTSRKNQAELSFFSLLFLFLLSLHPVSAPEQEPETTSGETGNGFRL